MSDGPSVTASRTRQWAQLSQFRRLTARMRTLPDFLVLGAMRCGTTSLYTYLSEHPDVLPSWTKEIHYLDRRYARGADWYRANFPLAVSRHWHALRHGRQASVFESTPAYMAHPDGARRLAGIVPKARLVVLLRNPADRAYSHYQLNVRSGRERHTFDKALEREGRRIDGERQRLLGDQTYRSRKYFRYGYRTRGLYLDQLLEYERFFGREQILVLKSEDFFEDTQQVYDEVVRFLDLQPWTLRSTTPVNVSGYSGAKPAGYDGLRESFAPHNTRLYDFLGRDFAW